MDEYDSTLEKWIDQVNRALSELIRSAMLCHESIDLLKGWLEKEEETRRAQMELILDGFYAKGTNKEET